MFRMTSEIKIGEVKVKPNAVTWKCSVADLCDTCTINLSVKNHCKIIATENKSAELQPKKSIFAVGDKVTVLLGYDGKNVERFNGFVSRITMGVPLTIECKGWAWKLKDVVLSKSYRSTTIKRILADIIDGTGLNVSPLTADVAVEKVTFKDAPALKAIEWMQKELACQVAIYGDTIYAGASRYSLPGGKIKFTLGWNTISDTLKVKELDTSVRIELKAKDATGSTKKVKNVMRKYDNVKEVNVRAGLPTDYLKKVLSEMQAREDYKGCDGAITAFLVPVVAKGDTVVVDDRRYAERSGRYFAEEVSGSFDKSGGRQTIKLAYYGKK